MGQAQDCDLRHLSAEEAYAKLRAACDRLGRGESLLLLADREPRPWLLRLQAERAHGFDWSPLEEGAHRVRVRVDRRSESAHGRTSHEYLSWDHDRLEARLADARRLLGAGDPAGARDAFREFRLGLLRHIRMEEEVLFPEFEARSGMREEGPTAVMRDEHRQIQQILQELADQLDPEPGRPLQPDRQAFESGVRALLSVLGEHNTKEEEVLYPVTDNMLGDKERSRLVERMQQV